jgi:hypothetical protein
LGMGNTMASGRELVLRCYAWKSGDEYYAECIDLNLVVSRPTLAQAILSLNDAIVGYLETVLEKGWLDEMVPRPSPWLSRVRYHLYALLHLWRQSVSIFDRVVAIDADHRLVYA